MKLHKRRGLITVWIVVAALVWLGGVLYFKPYGTELGVPWSPKRSLLGQIFDFWVLKLPWVLLCFATVQGNNKWLAPRGHYQEGVEYPLFSPHVYTAIALMSALFAACGIVHNQLFDLPAAAAALAGVYFNPIVTFFTVWIGGTIRALLFGQGDPISWFLSVGMSDGTTWMYLSLFYWLFKETKWGKKVPARVAFWIVAYWIWRPLTALPMYLWYVPSQALIPTMVHFLTVFMTSGTFASLAGVAVGEALIRSNESKIAPPTITLED